MLLFVDLDVFTFGCFARCAYLHRRSEGVVVADNNDAIGRELEQTSVLSYGTEDVE